MTMHAHISCLLLLFRRTENLHEVLEACTNGGVTEFFFALDGPRDETEGELQQIIVSKLSEYCDSKNVSYHFSRLRENRGILINMVTALDWFFEKVNFGVILEDDTIPSVEFFEFVRASKTFLDADKSIMMISGQAGNYNFRASEISFQYCSFPLIWGWATTREKWQIMRLWFFEDFLEKRRFRLLFDASHAFWKTGYKRVTKGRLDSWANVLAFRYRVDKLKSLVPTRTLVGNVGFDEHATHSKQRPAFKTNRTSTQENVTLDKWLETEVYGISQRHALAPVYGPILDMFKGRPKRVPPLEFLRNLAIQAEGPRQLRDLL